MIKTKHAPNSVQTASLNGVLNAALSRALNSRDKKTSRQLNAPLIDRAPRFFGVNEGALEKPKRALLMTF